MSHIVNLQKGHRTLSKQKTSKLAFTEYTLNWLVVSLNVYNPFLLKIYIASGFSMLSFHNVDMSLQACPLKYSLLCSVFKICFCTFVIHSFWSFSEAGDNEAGDKEHQHLIVTASLNK